MSNVTDNVQNLLIQPAKRAADMAKRVPGLEWLDTSDEQTIDWAYNYLQQHGKPIHGISGQRDAEALLKKGNRIEEAEGGREFLIAMRNAYRQNKWRTARPDLRNRTFRLHRSVAAKLDSLAKKKRVTPTDQVEALITDTTKVYAEISKKLKESKQRQKDEKLQANLREKGLQTCVTALEEMLSEALLKISYHETVCGTPTDVHGPVSNHYQQAWSEAQQKLETIRKQHAGLHEIKRAMDRA